MSTDQFSQYQTQQIMTASPAKLVYLLFDKAIACLKEAVRAIDAGEIEARWKANGRAMEIVEHLRMTLNMDAGGEVAQNLDQIYGLLLRELPKVDLKNDPRIARECAAILEPLRESWRVLAEKGEETTRQAAHAASRISKPAAAPARPQLRPEGPAGTAAPPSPGGIKISA